MPLNELLPKAQKLSHKNVKSHGLGTVAEFHLSDREHWFHVAPLFHPADAWATFAITWVGDKHVMIPVFDAEGVLRTFEYEGILEGWLLTGDLAVINEEAYVTIVDRKKDMIITGGVNVYSTEVGGTSFICALTYWRRLSLVFRMSTGVMGALLAWFKSKARASRRKRLSRSVRTIRPITRCLKTLRSWMSCPKRDPERSIRRA